MPQFAINRLTSVSGSETTNRKPPQIELHPRREPRLERQNSPAQIDDAPASAGLPHQPSINFPVTERLLNAREVAALLGVSERWVRDHTTRRFPKLRGVKLGTLMRYKTADVNEFMEKLTTSKSSMLSQFGG